MSANTAIFIHIHKTGGSSLNEIISHQYAPQRILSLYQSNPFKKNSTTPRYEALSRLSQEEKRRIALIRGHIAFGIHEFLPQPACYFTLVRNPISRMLSHYYYIQKSARNPNTKRRNYQKIAPRQLSKVLGTTLDQFIDNYVNQGKDNHQTRILAGLSGERYQGEVTVETLETAKENIRQHFALVGVIENFAAFVLLLQKTFGWNNSFFKIINQNSSKPKRQDIDSKTLHRLREVEKFDIQLYEFITLSMAEKIEAYGSSFQDELTHFNRLNQSLYGQAVYYSSSILAKLSRKLTGATW